ncbi:MAG: hypothetical protein NDJ72_10345 [Elusimicrobia bacterium]|nr:hypothetical protein [Elusimicrobiota bacterium]
MSDAYYAFYGRMIIAAFAFIFMVSGGIYAATRRADLVRQYCVAHLVALTLGTIVDIILAMYIMPRGGIPPAYVGGIFLAPIAFFVAFSIYICHRGTVLHAHDILIPIVPIVLWGLLVVFGGQRGMGDFDVLGAWFVSAGCGGVDIAASFGSPALTARPRRVKLAGYAFMLAAVYLILPWATA